jgi:trans-AT polyketide synthase/acyltransferase/oxidoreductase domain-containing protein
MVMTPALVYYRLSGLQRAEDGSIKCRHRIVAKVSRPEVAQAFLSPAPAKLVQSLLDKGLITEAQAEMGQQVAMSFDLCVEADSGGHTDQGVATVLLPAMQRLKQQIEQEYCYDHPIHIGLAGGIGAPESAASAFMMGADFILTGSINQCTVEGGTSDAVKDLLQDINVQDTDYAPAGDMFELGAKVQVLKKGVFFPARANKLLMLYNHYDCWEDIPDKIQQQLETRYFQNTFAQVWQEVQDYHGRKGNQATLDKATSSPKHKMALVFRWYFAYSNRLAFAGDTANKVDFQVHTGPALGAFNQWIKDTDLTCWRKRHVDEIAERLMTATAEHMQQHIRGWLAYTDVEGANSCVGC